MTIQEILDSTLSDSTKLELISYFLKGGSTEKRPKISFTDKIKVGNKTYNIAIAESDEEKTIGLSKTNHLNDNEGMLFIYDLPQPLQFTMEDTSIDLDIVFINGDEVVQVNSVESFTEEPIICQDADSVLEVNINSGIKIGDRINQQEQSAGEMLVLDEDGDVQYRLEGGERIFSRISTRKIVKQAYKAYGSDEDSDYIKLAKIVFKELNAQDSRDPEYVQSPT